MEGFGISDDGSDNKRLSRKKRAREWGKVVARNPP
jgi:hypothetical protein